jgi:type I restriction enzyme S subunit
MAREMKDSGVKWIGEIPRKWSVSKIKFLIANGGNSLRVGPFGSSLSGNDFTNEGYWVYNQRSVIDNNFEDNDTFICENKYNELKGFRVYPHDILITTRGSIGKVAIVPDKHFEGILHPCIIRFVLNDEKYNKYFLKHIFNGTDIVQQQIKNKSNSTTIDVLYSATLKNLVVPLPPLPEQQTIADFLDAKCAEIDGLLADLEAEVKTLAEYKKSIIAETVTRGLNPNAPMKQSGIPWAETIPEHWLVEPIYTKFHDCIYKNLDYEYQKAFKFNYGTLKYKDEAGDLSLYKATYINYSKVKKRDIIINGLNLNYDFISQRVAITPEDGIITSAYIALRPLKGVNSEYFNYLFKAMDNMKLFHGMGKGIRLTLSFDELKRVKIPIPSTQEQVKITNYLNWKCAAIDQSIADKQTQIETLKAYKSSLIYEYVTGKKQVI